MPYFGSNSLTNLGEVHQDLQMIFNEVIKHYDCSVICGYRGRIEQDMAFVNKKSKLRWPTSKHNALPSFAVDVIPYPTGYASLEEFYFLAGVVRVCVNKLLDAELIKYDIRWGGDWDRDLDLKDQNFNDLPHFELIEVSNHEKNPDC